MHDEPTEISWQGWKMHKHAKKWDSHWKESPIIPDKLNVVWLPNLNTPTNPYKNNRVLKYVARRFRTTQHLSISRWRGSKIVIGSVGTDGQFSFSRSVQVSRVYYPKFVDWQILRLKDCELRFETENMKLGKSYMEHISIRMCQLLFSYRMSATSFRGNLGESPVPKKTDCFLLLNVEK